TVSCTNGRTCPAGTVCDETHATCILQQQLSACAGKADFDACSFAGAAGLRVCRDGVCVLKGTCGNGVLEEGEDCDGIDLGGKTCLALGYYDGTPTCTATCRFDTSTCSGFCGDGITNGSEACDGSDLGGATCASQGFYGGTISCLSNCQLNLASC